MSFQRTTLFLRGLISVFLFLSILWLGGCSPAIDRYPRFSEERKLFDQATLIADLVILESSMSDTNRLDLGLNLQTGQAVIDSVAEILNRKSYNLQRRTLTSVGLLMNPSTPVRIIHPGEKFDGGTSEEKQLALASPPFYLNPGIQRDTTLRAILHATYSVLLNLPEDRIEGDSLPVVLPHVKILSQYLGSGLFFVLLAGGYNVSVAHEYGSPERVAQPLYGKIGMHETTQLSMRLFVLDGETGRLLWSDRRLKRGGTALQSNFLYMTSELLSEMP